MNPDVLFIYFCYHTKKLLFCLFFERSHLISYILTQKASLERFHTLLQTEISLSQNLGSGFLKNPYDVKHELGRYVNWIYFICPTMGPGGLI